MNLKKLILSILEEQPVETPTKPDTKPTTKPDTKPSKTPFRRPKPGHQPNPDARKNRKQREIEAFNKRHGIS
jgi:hypothetical protein